MSSATAIPQHQKIRKWFPGFEWLRLAFIASVVSLHLGLGVSLSGGGASVQFGDVLVFFVFSAAVPGFLMLSSFLAEIGEPSSSQRWRQILQAAALYGFWVGLWLIHTKARPSPGLIGVLEFGLRGGGWAFYFFAILLLQRLLALASSRLREKTCLFLGMAALLFNGVGFRFIGEGAWWLEKETYWWPIGFLACPFLGRWLALRFRREDLSPLTLLPVLMGWAIAVRWELLAMPASCPESRRLLPDYFRASPMLGALLSIMLALKFHGHVPKIVGWISRNSLGIFAIHCFVLRGVNGALVRVFLLNDDAMSRLLTLAVVLVGGAAVSEVLRRLLKERLV